MKLLIVDVGSLLNAINSRWPGRRLNYQGVAEMHESDTAVAIGHYVGKEHQPFMTVMKRLGYLFLLDKVEKASHAQTSVRLAMEVVQSNHSELIIGSNDPAILPLLRQQKESLIRVTLLTVSPTKMMTDAAFNTVMLGQDMLMPLKDNIEDIISDREIETPRGEKRKPGDPSNESK